MLTRSVYGLSGVRGDAPAIFPEPHRRSNVEAAAGPAWLQADTSAPIHDLTDVVGSIAATWCASSPLCAWFGRQTTRNFRSCRKRGIFGRRTSTKVSWKKDLAGLAKKFENMVGSQQILDSVDRDGSNLSASLTFCLQMPAETASGTCDTPAHSEDGWIFHEAMGHLDWMPGLTGSMLVGWRVQVLSVSLQMSGILE